LKAHIVKARNLTKIYVLHAEQIRAVDGVDVEIFEGDYVSLMGPSGSGKTTMLDMIGCLDSITSGSLEVLGQDVSTMPESRLVHVRRKSIGFVFQDFSLIPSLTALENIELTLYFAGINQKKSYSIRLLEKVGLAGRANHLPKQMSGGEKQRVAIARALATGPGFLLADEPTGHLDTETSQEIIAVFEQLNQEDGLTIMLATHDVELASKAPKCIRLRDGKIESKL
jgi:putative ABC transport system ATP-binding protein